MKIDLVLGSAAACLMATMFVDDYHARIAGNREMEALLGGQGAPVYCYYENSVTCDHAYPAKSCNENCEWHDRLHPDDPDDPHYGIVGDWKCPEGMDQDITVVSLVTTIKVNSEQRFDDGWWEDKEWEDSQDCNEIYNCGCDQLPGPRAPFYQGVPPCARKGDPLDSPTGLFREPFGDQDCPSLITY